MSHSALEILGIPYNPARGHWNSIPPGARRLWLQFSGLRGYSSYSFQYWDELPASLIEKLTRSHKSLGLPGAQA